MEHRLELDIMAQPDDTTCGPTCLHAVYGFYGDTIPLEQVVRETEQLEEGGTLAVLLGCHALKRNYRATIYTYNLSIFDPTWFQPKAPPLAERLAAQLATKDDPKLRWATRAYIEFTNRGGKILMEDLSGGLIRRYLRQSIPILTGLSSTYLYRGMREFGRDGQEDDLRGYPAGHFVVLCGYDKSTRTALVADPLRPNPIGATDQYYHVRIDRLRCAILLGIVTYDANLLIIEPPGSPGGVSHADSHSN